jgi:hypothetical protein
MKLQIIISKNKIIIKIKIINNNKKNNKYFNLMFIKIKDNKKQKESPLIEKGK